jgi:DNA polymerase-1
MSLKKSLQNQPTLLIDADLYLYRACAAAEQEVNWGDDVWSLSTDLKVAKATVQNLIQRWCEKFETVDFVMCISDRENFRKEIYPSYKGNRKGVRKPVGYKALVQWARDVYVTHTEAFL